MALLLAVAAAIHLVLTPEHFREHVAYGLFFLGASVVQLALAFALILRPSPLVFRAGILSSLVLIATWLATRAIAPPFSDAAEEVTLMGVLAKALELAALLLLAMGLPAGGGKSSARPARLNWTWGVVGGALFVLLFLFATGSLAVVDPDLGAERDLPWAEVTTYGVSLQSPWLTVAPTHHLLLGVSVPVAAFLVLAAALVAANTALVVALARSGSARRPQTGGVLAVAPAFAAAPTCCGAGLPIGFAFGGGTAGTIVAATPWVLLGTIVLLALNVVLLLRRRRAACALPAAG